MSLVRFTRKGELKPVRKWARPHTYEGWLALLSARDYKAIVHAMHASIDRFDLVRAQYVVCKAGDEWNEVYLPA